MIKKNLSYEHFIFDFQKWIFHQEELETLL